MKLLNIYIHIYFFYSIDVDECLNLSTRTCDVNAFCTNTEGSFVCNCSLGYIGDGFNCSELLDLVLVFDNERYIYLFLILGLYYAWV